jgi:hypothetical protein
MLYEPSRLGRMFPELLVERRPFISQEQPASSAFHPSVSVRRAHCISRPTLGVGSCFGIATCSKVITRVSGHNY